MASLTSAFDFADRINQMLSAKMEGASVTTVHDSRVFCCYAISMESTGPAKSKKTMFAGHPPRVVLPDDAGTIFVFTQVNVRLNKCDELEQSYVIGSVMCRMCFSDAPPGQKGRDMRHTRRVVSEHVRVDIREVVFKDEPVDTRLSASVDFAVECHRTFAGIYFLWKMSQAVPD